jgi:hypothetical protein
MLDEKPTGTTPKRWPRGQKFTVSDAGLEVEESYRATVTAARSSGRPALEAALAAWSEPRGLSPGDGIVLSELRGKRLGLPDLCRGLEAAGIEPDEVRAAVGRLVTAGAVQALPLASQLGA